MKHPVPRRPHRSRSPYTEAMRVGHQPYTVLEVRSLRRGGGDVPSTADPAAAEVYILLWEGETFSLPPTDPTLPCPKHKY